MHLHRQYKLCRMHDWYGAKGAYQPGVSVAAKFPSCQKKLEAARHRFPSASPGAEKSANKTPKPIQCFYYLKKKKKKKSAYKAIIYQKKNRARLIQKKRKKKKKRAAARIRTQILTKIMNVRIYPSAPFLKFQVWYYSFVVRGDVPLYIRQSVFVI